MIKKILLLLLIGFSNLAFAEPNPNLNSWQRMEDKDEMRGSVTNTYVIFSKADKVSDKIGMILEINKKQNMVSFMSVGRKNFATECLNTCVLTVKFDDNPVEDYKFKSVSYNAMVHIPKKNKQNKFSNEFIQKILNSKQLIIEFKLVNGREQLKFKTEGLLLDKEHLEILNSK